MLCLVGSRSVVAIHSMIGVIVDPTTAGVGDSERALGYEEPWEDK